MKSSNEKRMEKIVSLCKRRGFVFPSSEIYGGLANSWDFGPLGVEIKNNIKQEWWKIFVRGRSDIVGLDSSIIMNPRVWEASGHLAGFSDPLIECKECHRRFRADHLIEDEVWNKEKDTLNEKRISELIEECPGCGKKGTFGMPRNFSLMLKTFLGPLEDDNDRVYLRPETAQGMFIDFKNLLGTSRKSIPFGVAQIGKAFRNEITPGNFIFRTREFEMMEIEYFIKPPKNDSDWEEVFEEWRRAMRDWIIHLGISLANINEFDVPKEELAHYSKKTIDFEYNFPFGVKELYGLAYRTDFDLKNHEENSGKNMKYRDISTGEEYWPHTIEPSFGLDRTFLAVLVESYREDEIRVFMKFPAWLAPVKVAVLPLVKNNSDLVVKAMKIYNNLKMRFTCEYDESGTIGRRYRRQDEIGTPLAITVDFDTLKDNKVTIRDRDTMEQVRVDLEGIETYLKEKLNA